MDDYLEDDFREPYTAWKANPTPAANAQMLRTLEPVIDKGIRTHVGEPNPLLVSRARKLALEGLRSYDPKRARLQTHLFGQFQGLKRINRQQSQVIKAPERVQIDAWHLQNAEQELTDLLGRPPTDRELADHSGFNYRRITRVRQFQPGVSEGHMESVAPAFQPGVLPDQADRTTWLEIVYDDLPPLDQQIMEMSMGLHGRQPMSNQEIAKALRRSPGAISQRKKRIQQALDQESNLSPFWSES